MEANLLITRIYQWLSEMIVFYFILLLLFFLANETFSLVLYLSLTIGSITTYTLVGKHSNKFGPIVITTFLIACCAYFLLHYPLFISLLVAIVFCWRYIAHQEIANHNHQIILFVLTFMIVMGILVFSNDTGVIFLVLLQFFVLVGGATFSNYFIENQNNRFNKKAILFLLSSPFIVGTLLWLLFDFIRWVYVFLGKILVTITTWSFLLLDEWIHLDMSSYEDEQRKLKDNMEGNLTRFQQNEMNPVATANEVNITEISYWILNSFLIILVVIASFVIFRKIMHREIATEKNVYATISKLPALQTQDKAKFPFVVKKPNNMIRKEIFDLEKFSHKRGCGRKRGESLTDWFKRLQLPLEGIDLYQNVRYGNKQISKEEEAQFKEQMKKIRFQMEQQ
ncbi:hypothetical protein NC661_06435 [Aquibacillus koreensis]|uniref:DUF4129 domain-containing protein n=1 Tax=Aquibacillus koreensis TaxID=279446 RepID=A0A9X3WKK4_9BACI|nr:hypothetical protein [Aquibacillus koreensis]MCT2535709.1 hypothetical protein [Aquibacillus koreensis]MDC3420006.1 hypothetical protein [Aquibacillus koreensis]